MDPITMAALIGAGGSLLGGFMNTSSAQAINTSNLQQQMFLANNAVSMRVDDAKRAGINPLAALGVSTPGFVGATPTDPGAGLMAAGRQIASMDPLAMQKLKLDVEKSAADVFAARAAGNNAMQQTIRTALGNDRISKGLPPEPGFVAGMTGDVLQTAIDPLSRSLDSMGAAAPGYFQAVKDYLGNYGADVIRGVGSSEPPAY